MNRTTKFNKITATALAAVMLLGAVFFTGFDLIGIKTSAADVGSLTFSLINNDTEYAVSDCKITAAGTVTIPDTYSEKPVTAIGDEAFKLCALLKEIKIPATVTSIGDEAFEGCTLLSEIEIPAAVTEIGDEAFKTCSNLKTVSFAQDSALTSIGKEAFANCIKLEKIALPDTLKVIPESLFANCTNLESVTTAADITEIGKSAFAYCISLKSFTLPGTVTAVADSTFVGCSSLTAFTIPSGVTAVGASAFSGCTELKSVEIPESVTSIDKSAFAFCSSLTGVIIPSKVVEISDNTFSSCTSLTDVTIPSGVTTIGSSAFAGCTSLSGINLPSGLKVLGSYSFSGCIALANVTLPNGLNEIGSSAFNRCASITAIVIPETVTKIGSGAFNDCTALTAVSIPRAVNSIGSGVFSGCTALESITVDENNLFYSSESGVLFNKNKTVIIQYPVGCKATEYEIPDSVINIESSAFSGCTALTAVTVGEDSKLENIGFGAFSGCSGLKLVGLPLSLKRIENSAYYNCTAIKTVNYEGTTVDWLVVSIGDNNTCLTGAYWNYGFVKAVTVVVIASEPDRTDYFEGENINTNGMTLTVTYNDGTTKTVTAGYTCSETEFDELGNKTVTVTYGGQTCTYNVTVSTCPTVTIKNNPGTKTVNYGDGITLTATATDLPEGAEIQWYVNGEYKASGESYTLTGAETDAVVTVKVVDKNGETVTKNGEDIDTEEKVEVNSGIWQKIISIFKNIFRINRVKAQ